jgi:hypothetical protein
MSKTNSDCEGVAEGGPGLQDPLGGKRERMIVDGNLRGGRTREKCWSDAGESKSGVHLNDVSLIYGWLPERIHCRDHLKHRCRVVRSHEQLLIRLGHWEPARVKRSLPVNPRIEFPEWHIWVLALKC